MITMKTINASNQEERDAFFTSLDQRTGETNQRVTETVSEIIRTVKAGGDDIQTILDDPEVGYVAECMGGVNPAYQFVRSCLEAGKSVATSNKQLVAEKGDYTIAVDRQLPDGFGVLHGVSVESLPVRS